MSDMTDLQERLLRARDNLAGNLANTSDPDEMHRLRGKVQGVKLALSYVGDALRTAQPAEETR